MSDLQKIMERTRSGEIEQLRALIVKKDEQIAALNLSIEFLIGHIDGIMNPLPSPIVRIGKAELEGETK